MVVERGRTWLSTHGGLPSEEQQKEFAAMIAPDVELSALHLDDSQHMGYTFKTAACGIWALRAALRSPAPMSAFEPVIVQLAMAGGDSDTNCAVAGGVLGAFVGYDNLPSWKTEMKHAQWLLTKADAAAAILGLDGVPAYDPTTDNDALVDAGQGPVSPEELAIDRRWKILTEDSHRRMGQTNPGEKVRKCQCTII